MSLKRKGVEEENSFYEKGGEQVTLKKQKMVMGTKTVVNKAEVSTGKGVFGRFCIGYYSPKAEEASQSKPPKSK